MEWMEKLQSGLEPLEKEGSEALASVQDDAMSFLDHLKQHLTQNPEPVFAVLRRLMPVLIVKNTALVTRFEDVQEVLSRDDVLLAQYVFEALRFNPNNPGVFRIAAEDYTVAKDKIHATTIPRGASVIAATQSAMFDERIVDAPNEFRTGRPIFT